MNRCYECASVNNVVLHHIVPQSRGGKRTIALCQLCHDKVHGHKTPRDISVSQLTRDGLKKAKQRGVKLGNPNAAKAWTKAVQAIKQGKKDFAATALTTIREIQSTGIYTLAKIADCLNKRGEKTARGGTWTATAVKRIVEMEN